MFVHEDGVLAALLWHDHITYNSLIKTHSPMLKDFTAITTINFRNLSSLPTGTPRFAYHQPNLHSHSQPPTCSSFCMEWCIVGHIYIKTCLPCSFTEWLISCSITPSRFFFVVTSTTTGGETWNSFFLEVSNFFFYCTGIPHGSYPLMSWLTGCFHLLAIMNDVSVHMQIPHSPVFSFLLHSCLGWEWPDNSVFVTLPDWQGGCRIFHF